VAVVQILVLDVEPGISLGNMYLVGMERESLWAPDRQYNIPGSFRQRAAHGRLLTVEHQVVVAGQAVPQLGLARSSTLGWSDGHGVQPVFDGTCSWVSLDTYCHVQIILVSAILVVHAGYVALVLVVELRTATRSFQTGTFTVDLRDAEVPP